MNMMNRILRFAPLFLLIATTDLIVFRVTAVAAVPPRERISLNADWRFQKGDPPGLDGRLAYEKIKDWVTASGNEFVLSSDANRTSQPAENLGGDVSFTQRDFDDRAWRQLNLPHDWGIEGPFNQDYPGETGKLPWWGVAWYRKHFNVSLAEKGRQVYLDIDGAMSYATVWLNGKFVGGWPYGYASFELDLTPYIEYGQENVLAIRLDNPPDSSRWYPGGGIYRNVWLVKTASIHVGHWGTYVTTPDVSASSATASLKFTVDNDSAAPVTVTLKTQIFQLGSGGQKLRAAVASGMPVNLKAAARANQTGETRIQINRPRLWNLQKPNLYAAVTNVEQNGKAVDKY